MRKEIVWEKASAFRATRFQREPAGVLSDVGRLGVMLASLFLEVTLRNAGHRSRRNRTIHRLRAAW